MRRTVLIAIVCCYSGFGQTGEPASADPGVDMTALKQMEVDRLRSMAASGAVPRSRLEQAQSELEDSADNAILRRTLYGAVRIEDLTKEQSDEMVLAAERLLERQKSRYERMAEMVEGGILPRNSLNILTEEMGFRQKTLDLARFRAKLLDELAEQARAEEALEASSSSVLRGGLVERFDGRALFRDADFLKIDLAFQRRFGRSLPVSARGETALHKSLGFDHRGRVDVALNPDQQEGIWLRSLMKKSGIPYYAFRGAVRGKATGAHIHMGPPSQRYRAAD